MSIGEIHSKRPEGWCEAVYSEDEGETGGKSEIFPLSEHGLMLWGSTSQSGPIIDLPCMRLVSPPLILIIAVRRENRSDIPVRTWPDVVGSTSRFALYNWFAMHAPRSASRLGRGVSARFW